MAIIIKEEKKKSNKGSMFVVVGILIIASGLGGIWYYLFMTPPLITESALGAESGFKTTSQIAKIKFDIESITTQSEWQYLKDDMVPEIIGTPPMARKVNLFK
jgi:hypothetical protein